MDSFNILWQVGVIASVLVFGIKIGLATGMANYSKKIILIISCLYGVGVYLITRIASLFASQVVDFVYGYNAVFFLIMAVIMISAGLLTVREWKVHEKNTSSASALAIVAPCPCCFMSIVASILLVAPTVGLGVNDLSPYVAVALALTILITYFASNSLISYIKKPYPVILGNFMFFLGIYFLISAIVIPNIASVLGKSMGAITLENTGYIIWVIVILIVLLIFGVVISKKNRLFE
ncbi:DUF2162 domain-containing protein [Methanobrevibacter curvatus]|uniref:Transporter n=1 Tax=Methanobrevibacter curvatus TaxID=49547 RepID=A0A166CDJ1_9EURY|nr:DUF2162 domain-containing protein [Methanobrevibacter curvatus]KZX14394.1 hypothetical protein MBCUR_05130 [Methanobrevibacter curvatus]